MISVVFNFLTHGCPKICFIPPNEPNLLDGSFTKSPYNNILISGDNSTCCGKSI
jgi:hypothetical protein